MGDPVMTIITHTIIDHHCYHYQSQWIVWVHGENEIFYIFWLMQNFIELYELLMSC